jgi:PAS domain S-box-containing protein
MELSITGKGTMNILDFVAPKFQDENKALLSRLQNQEMESFITERRRKDGTTVQVWLTISRLLDEQGKLAAIATTERDIARLSPKNLVALTGEALGKKGGNDHR